MTGMYENPYESPKSEQNAAAPKGLCLGRCIALIFIVPSLGMAGVSCLILKWIFSDPNYGQNPTFTVTALWHFANAVAWLAVAWGIMKTRSRLVIGALAADLLLVALAVLSG